MSVKPCELVKLVPLSELERLQNVVHHLHVRQLVDSLGPRFSAHINYVEDQAENIPPTSHASNTNLNSNVSQSHINQSAQVDVQEREAAATLASLRRIISPFTSPSFELIGSAERERVESVSFYFFIHSYPFHTANKQYLISRRDREVVCLN